MNQFVCTHPLVPMRSEPEHRSEQVSQLLFGETAEAEEKQGGWLKIRSIFDEYTGWVEEGSMELLNENENPLNVKYVLTPLSILIREKQTIYIPAGSEIPALDTEKNFTLANRKYHLQNEILSPLEPERKNLIITSVQFLNAPYLWGGRTVFGFDCSGYVQIVFKSNGVKLKRDAADQAEQGVQVEKLDQAIPGDLLFFTGDTSQVSHVGMFLGEKKIIHASVSVRIDTIDEKGIYNTDKKSYTHNLNSIRRVI